MNKKIFWIIWFVVFGGIILFSSLGGTEGRECPICDKTYYDSKNMKSIRQTGMCKNCYENYEYLKDYIGK